MTRGTDKGPPGAWRSVPLQAALLGPGLVRGRHGGWVPGCSVWGGGFPQVCEGFEMLLSLWAELISHSFAPQTLTDHPFGARHCAGLWGHGGGHDGHGPRDSHFMGEDGHRTANCPVNDLVAAWTSAVKETRGAPWW